MGPLRDGLADHLDRIPVAAQLVPLGGADEDRHFGDYSLLDRAC